MASDIGFLIFAELLGMAEYPGAPFTGNVVKDLIMFLLIPTIFIILIIYMMLGRLLPPTQGKLRMLVAVGAYLFIIAGGYYRAFAYLAGPYFLFLIFIMGLLFFILEHFTGGNRAAGGGTATSFEIPTDAGQRKRWIDRVFRQEKNIMDRREAELAIAAIDEQLEYLDRLAEKPGAKINPEEITRLVKMKNELRHSLGQPPRGR